MPIVFDRRLQTCSDAELRRLAQKLSDAWEAKGCPDFRDMPRVMLGEWDALQREFNRRGVPLTLF